MKKNLIICGSLLLMSSAAFAQNANQTVVTLAGVQNATALDRVYVGVQDILVVEPMDDLIPTNVTSDESNASFLTSGDLNGTGKLMHSPEYKVWSTRNFKVDVKATGDFSTNTTPNYTFPSGKLTITGITNNTGGTPTTVSTASPLAMPASTATPLLLIDNAPFGASKTFQVNYNVQPGWVHSGNYAMGINYTVTQL